MLLLLKCANGEYELQNEIEVIRLKIKYPPG